MISRDAMDVMLTHRITITSRPYPGDSGIVYIATCSCGRYTSGKQVASGAAESNARDHVEAKLGDAFDAETFHRDMEHVDD